MKARLHLERDFSIAEVGPTLFGSFVEQLGRAVYGGLYQPEHPSADARGFRRDVLALVRELGVSLVRYPGGNFVSSYNWEDSVGPLERRPSRLDLAWRSIEPNRFGLGEYLSWLGEAGAEAMLAVNLGTRGVDAARELVEYCNHPSGTRLSDLRRSHGADKPYDIRLWCLGNEMDGPWQVGQKGAAEYGRLARESAKAMKLVDPRIQVVACGSSYPSMPSFPRWEAEVLAECYDEVDYLSLHSYYGNAANDLGEYLAASVGMELFIKSVASACDFVKADKRSRKTMMLSFDEWNVWFHTQAEDRHRSPWRLAPPLLEEAYSFEDALVVGCLLITLLGNADRVKIACMAQLVNVIAPIMTNPEGEAWRQTTFYPFLHASRYGRGSSLRLVADSPSYETKAYGEVPYLTAAAVLNAEAGELTLFAVNRSGLESLELEAHLGGLNGFRALERIEYRSPDPKRGNSADFPLALVPRSEEGGFAVDGETLSARLPPLSWNVLRLKRG